MLQQRLDDLSHLRREDDLGVVGDLWIEKVVIDQQAFDVVRLLADLQRFQLQHVLPVG